MQILFLHGLESGPQGAKYHALAAAFGTVVAPDCSGISDERARLRIIEGEIAGQPGPFLVVGSSMGGLMALLLQQSLPQRIAGLVLCAPALQRPAAAGLDLNGLPPTRVIHGRWDNVVPITLSRPFGDRLIEVDDDHRLLDSLPELIATVRSLLKDLRAGE